MRRADFLLLSDAGDFPCETVRRECMFGGRARSETVIERRDDHGFPEMTDRALRLAGAAEPGGEALVIVGGCAPEKVEHVAANGDRFVISSGGSLLRIGGTSASAPLWGAVVTLINEARLEAGKKPVGFMHPVLYAQ